MVYNRGYSVRISFKNEQAWESGRSETGCPKCEWKNQHCDISTKHAGQMMIIEAFLYTEYDHDEFSELIGRVELDVSAWIVPCQKAVELFDKNDLLLRQLQSLCAVFFDLISL